MARGLESFQPAQQPIVELQPPSEGLAITPIDLAPSVGVEHIERTATGAEFQVGEVTYSYLGNTPSAMEFNSIGPDGVVRPLLVYRSNSGGSYRVSQGYEKNGNSRRLMKGPELSPNAQYTQDTQLHPLFDEKVGRIEESRQLRVLPQRPEVVYPEQDATTLLNDFEAQTEVYVLGDSRVDAALHTMKAGSLSVHDVAQITGVDSKNDAFTAGVKLQQKITALNTLLHEAGVMPDFSGEPITMGISNHAQLGPVVKEVFEQTKDGRTYQWEMAHDMDGRVWIERIRFANAEPSAYGTDKQTVYSGVLTSKPLDYAKQSEGLPSRLRKDMGNGYDDISEFLKTLAPVSQYAQNYHKRDHLVHITAA